jgi:TolA-binding protein
VQDHIKTGEFFGVKSALGRYPREENAVVLSDASVLMFSVPEFEQLASQNTRIIMKMLKVFSNQLRRLHAKVRNLLDVEEQVDPEEGLFQIGEYYMKKRQYAQALYAFNKYLTYYPAGKYHQQANKMAQTAEDYAQKYGPGKGPGMPTSEAGGAASTAPGGSAAGSPESGSAAGSAAGGSAGGSEEKAGSNSKEGGRQLSGAAREYYDAVSLFSQQQYQEAMKAFKAIVEKGEDEEYVVKSLFEIGRCLYNLAKYDAAIKHFTNLIQKYPKIQELKDALYYLGLCYQQKGEEERAKSFYDKILSMDGVDEGLKRKVNKAIRSLGAA